MKSLLPFIFVLFFALVAYPQSATVVIDKANLRGTPSERGRVVSVLYQDAQVRVIRHKGAWVLVRSSTIVGWLPGRTIKINNLSRVDVVKKTRPDRFTIIGSSDSDTGARATGDLEQVLPPMPTPRPVPPRTVSGGVLNGKAISLPKPVYPAAAIAVRAGGAVSVQVLIDESGRVISASAVSGHPLLKAAAVVAARAARFPPTLFSVQPVRVSGVITYNFVP